MSDDSSDRNVFILGAGFSASAGAPLINDFLDVSRDIFDDPDSELDDYERTVFQTAFDFKKHVAQAREKFDIDLDDIEQLFGLVEMSHRLDTATENVRDAMVYLIAKTLQLAVARKKHRPYIRMTLDKAYENSNPTWAALVPQEASPGVFCPDVYQHFALLLSGRYDDPHKNKSRSNIAITFNYDLVLDDALRRIGVAPFYGLPNISADDQLDGPDAQSVSVLKLHGSTNWAICSACRQVHVLGTKWTTDAKAFRARACAKCKQGKLNLLLVPPSWDKSEYRETMRPVWKKAVDALKTAKRIVVIGYSMPGSDTFFKFLLTLGLAENHQLHKFVLVDLARSPSLSDVSQGGEIPHSIESRYRAILGKLFAKRRFMFFPNGFGGFLADGVGSIRRAEMICSLGLY